MSKDSIRNRKRFFIDWDETKSKSKDDDQEEKRNIKKFTLRIRESTVEDLKEMRLDRIDRKTWLYDKWKEKWNEGVEGDDDSPFYKLFCFDYMYTCNACVRNKRKNFLMKFLCILPLLLIFIIFIIIKGIEIKTLMMNGAHFGQFIGDNIQKISMIETNIIIVAVILTIAISKWVNVKKYQETWNRHSAHKYEIEIQMFRYISEMGEYGYSGRKADFINTIMGTWSKNQNKFNKNMKNEEQVGDVIKNIKDIL